MAEETATETTGTTEAAASEEHQATVLDITREEMAKDSESEPEGEQSDRKGRPGRPAKEYLGKLREENAALTSRATEAEGKVTAYESQIKSLSDRLDVIDRERQAGTITRAEAQAKTADVQTAIEEIELDGELMPYKDQLLAAIRTEARKQAQELVKPLMEAESQRKAEAYQREVKQFQEDIAGNLKTILADYPELSDGEDDSGFPILKPEYEKRLMELAEVFNEPFVDHKTGEQGIFNRALVTKEGQKMLLNTVYREIDLAKAAKAGIDKTNSAVAQAKKGRIESSDSLHVSPAKEKTILDFTREAFKEIPGG